MRRGLVAVLLMATFTIRLPGQQSAGRAVACAGHPREPNRGDSTRPRVDAPRSGSIQHCGTIRR